MLKMVMFMDGFAAMVTLVIPTSSDTTLALSPVPSFFHKSEAWKTQCTCANQGVLYVTDAAFCLTQRWSTARAELNQVLGRLKRLDITLGDLYKGGAMGIQLFLIFNAGKVLGRGSFQGYSLGPSLYDTFPDKNAPKGHH